MIKKYLSLAVLAGVFALLTPLYAHAEVIGTDGSTIQVELDNGALVKLDSPASAVFVSNPEIADVQIKTPTLIYVFGKAAGQTDLFAVDGQENVLLKKGIVVNYNLARLKASLGKMLPGMPIDIASMDGGVVLSGQVMTAADAENARNLAAKFVGSEDAVINNLTVVGANQINLRVRIAEVSRDMLKSFGFNWDGLLTNGSIVFGAAIGNAVQTGGNFATRTAGNSLFGTITPGNWTIDGMLDLLEQEGMITVLAEPNLTAVSGETANFLAGGEFPVPVGQQNGVVTVEFKPFGVGLAFTPTIVGSNRINMRIRPEVSQISNQNSFTLQTGQGAPSLTIPSLTTRRAETTIEMGSGQSFAIAGLIQQNSTQDIKKIPALGDIPILGSLFKSDRFNRRETELVIIATPYIVRPGAAKPQAPTDNLTFPTDFQRATTTQTYQQIGKPADAPPSNAGFIME